MRLLTSLALLALLAPNASAQAKTAILPSTLGFAQTNNYPFAGPVMRYQQVYYASDLIATIKMPVRINQLEFKAGSPGGQPGATVDMEVSIANGPVQVSGTFDQNLLGGKLTVPRKSYLLGSAVGYPMTVPLGADFVWDGQSNVVVEVKIFGNGFPGGQSTSYQLESTTTQPLLVARLYTIGNPNAVTAVIVQQGWGITTRFTYNEGVTTSFGFGCPGLGNITPIASTVGGLPFAGNTNWAHAITKAAPARNAILVIGTSNKQWGQLQLPLDLTLIGAPGCQLLTDPWIQLWGVTTGGGAGGGSTVIPTPLPPVTFYVGLSAYSQFLVLDPGAPNGVLASTQGLWTIFGR
jgi:hypothetical protein